MPDFWSDFRQGQAARDFWEARHNRRSEREAAVAQRNALRKEFGDRSGGNTADVSSLNTVDAAMAERRRGAQIAGLGITRQILAAPPEQQASLAQQYAPMLSQAFGVRPEEVFAGLDAIRNSPNPDEAIAQLQGSLADPALNRLTGSPSLVGEDGTAAAVTQGGQVRSFPGYRLATVENTNTRVDEDRARRLAPAPQAGVRYNPDESGIVQDATIIPGTPQAQAQRTAEIEEQQARNEADAPNRARQSVSSSVGSALQSYMRLDELGAAVRPGRGAAENFVARARNSQVGQMLEGYVGTEAQQVRDTIESIRPVLIASLVQATGMSARSLDSNRELDFYLTAISDPRRSYYANIGALVALDNAFGSGDVLDQLQLDPETRRDIEREAMRFRAEAPSDPAMDQFRNDGEDRQPTNQQRPAPTDGRSRNDSLDTIRQRLRRN